MGKNNEKTEIVRNSWALIQSRQSNTLFENKLTIAAIDQCFRNDDGSLSATFKIPDIKNMVGTTSYTSLKDAIKKISYNTMHYVLFIEEDDDDGFKLVNVFKHIAFNDKEKTLEVALNEDLRQYINPKENFTLMRKKTLMAFKSNFSYRLYEILMSRAYHLEEHDSYTFAVSLNDLRLQLGLVNVRQKYIANAIESNIPADIIVEEIARSKKEKIEEMKKMGQYDANASRNVTDDVKFREWGDFKKRVLEIAKKEINAMPFGEIVFDYEMEKEYRTHKVTGIIFTILPKHVQTDFLLEEMPDVTEGPIKQVHDLCMDKLTQEQFAALLQLADGDTDKIEYFYRMALTYHLEKKYIYSWLVNAIKTDNEKPQLIEDKKVSESDIDDLVNDPETRKLLLKKLLSE